MSIPAEDFLPGTHRSPVMMDHVRFRAMPMQRTLPLECLTRLVQTCPINSPCVLIKSFGHASYLTTCYVRLP